MAQKQMPGGQTDFLLPEIGADLAQLGWTAHRRHTLFHYKTRLKTTEEQSAFHQWISRVLLGPLQPVWSKADEQHFWLRK